MRGTIAWRTCLTQNQHFGSYLLKGSLNFAYIWYRKLSYGFLLKTDVYSPEKSSPPILGPFWSKFTSFWPEINILACISQTARWILLICRFPECL